MFSLGNSSFPNINLSVLVIFPFMLNSKLIITGMWGPGHYLLRGGGAGISALNISCLVSIWPLTFLFVIFFFPSLVGGWQLVILTQRTKFLSSSVRLWMFKSAQVLKVNLCFLPACNYFSACAIVLEPLRSLGLKLPKPVFIMTSLFPAGPWTDWNLEPWQPSPPLRLPPPQAWSPLLCDSNSRKWRKCWCSRSVLFFWALSSSFMLLCPHCCIHGSMSVCI